MPQVALEEFVTQVASGAALGSFPTDTVPALAARPDQSDRIYALKDRPTGKPLILMGADLADLLPYVVGTAAEIQTWQAVAAQYWPGALTLVLPASDRVPAAMNPQGTGTLGIRVPNHPLARHLLARTGPLATTSVNRSGQPPLTQMTDIAAQFPQLLILAESAMVFDRPLAIATLTDEIGPISIVASGSPSTVVRWTGKGWEVLRQGAVRVMGSVRVDGFEGKG
ncbi:L-threonylcarbamoyladenylate synthase [Leptolyngbya sp. PCC 6406]|uniref:L-threonylcarbamoyladenylate synthase n=1 Tax=Leptolyngbya sp. PCC 6406 TaxID=1173264 RepID=UPI0002ABD09B|nr:L-threonylcarbamoyladenylate synthase [Leptolyngbya sp. PCC 6406]